MKEHATIALEYQRQSTRLHNKLEKDQSTKIWLQQDALKALPDYLKKAAEEIDETPPPADRPWPRWQTPPIKGFNPKDFDSNTGASTNVENPY